MTPFLIFWTIQKIKGNKISGITLVTQKMK